MAYQRKTSFYLGVNCIICQSSPGVLKNKVVEENQMPEQVKCVLHNIKKSKMFGSWDAFNVAVTDSRCIFAKLTADLLKKAAAEANEAGKAEGKGFLGRWGDQMSATMGYGNRYMNYTPDQVLQETKDNFAINFTDIKSIDFKEKRRIQDAGKIIHRIYGEVTFDTARGKMVYMIDGMPVDDIAAMKVVIGGKVRG